MHGPLGLKLINYGNVTTTAQILDICLYNNVFVQSIFLIN
jgi:hypothetical protein